MKAKPIKKSTGKKSTGNKMKPKKVSSVKPKVPKAVGKTKPASKSPKISKSAKVSKSAKISKSAKVSKSKAVVKSQMTTKGKLIKKVVKKAAVRKRIEGNPEPLAIRILDKKFKPNKKTRYNQKELQYFKEVIVQERNAILESARANMRSLVDSETGEYVGANLTYSSHMAEQGTDEMEREKNYLFVQRDEKYLGYLQESLSRIDQGTYGVCVDCMEEPKNLCKTCPLIPKERLELVPITQHCIECKNRRG